MGEIYEMLFQFTWIGVGVLLFIGLNRKFALGKAVENKFRLTNPQRIYTFLFILLAMLVVFTLLIGEVLHIESNYIEIIRNLLIGICIGFFLIFKKK